MGVQNILGYYVWGTNYPRIFCRGVQNILGYLVGGGYKISKWDAKYPRIICTGVQNTLGYFVGGYKISCDTGLDSCTQTIIVSIPILPTGTSRLSTSSESSVLDLPPLT